ncbi:MAG: hypothetical protein JXQ83_12205 [Candidatus Glassbacteria bacterium]|nr:hypothetical protein [Candidatus Glassbacteria bacterium]
MAADWNDFTLLDNTRLRFPMQDEFYETPWVLFHRAALRQCRFFLENPV